MVFRLAIVEDEKQDSDLLQSHIHHFLQRIVRTTLFR